MVEELYVNHSPVIGRKAHVDATHRLADLGVVAGHGDGNGAQVEDVYPRRGEPRYDGPLYHPGAAVRVPVYGYGGALGEGRAVSGAQFGGELRREVHVHRAGDAVAPEEGAPNLSAPHHGAFDGSAGFDFLARPELHLGVNHRSPLDSAAIA